MTLLYSLGILVYYGLILIVSAFNKKAKQWIKGRRGVLKLLRSKIGPHDRVIWFHVSSLGEFEQGRPVMEALKKEFPEHKILLTFFSPSGYEIRKHYSGADIICYLPLDTFFNARRFIGIAHPELTIFVKYDFWYHMLRQAKKSGSKLILISAAFRENQIFFKPYGKWYRKMLGWFDHLFVQNQESLNLLKKHNLNKCTLAGDTRFDRVSQIAHGSKEIEIANTFSKKSFTIVCGSTWPADEHLLLRYLHETHYPVKLILAPHEIHHTHISAIEKQLKTPYALFSKAREMNYAQARVLIIDNIGMLSSLYRYGQVAYIGGGFGVSIHNTLEAAVYGIPVLFGPQYHKFQEARDLLLCNGARTFLLYEELKEMLDGFFVNSELLENSGKAAGNYVSSMRGATQTITDYLKNN